MRATTQNRSAARVQIQLQGLAFARSLRLLGSGSFRIVTCLRVSTAQRDTL